MSIGALLAVWLATILASAAVPPESAVGLLAVGQNADGRLELFKTDTEGALLHRWQKVPNGEWSPWASLGGNLAPGLAVANDPGGALAVFGVDKARQVLQCIHQKTANGHEWGDWVDLGGRFRAPVTVGQSLDRRLGVFAVDAQSQSVKCTWQTNAAGGWSAWLDLGGSLEPGLAVGRNSNGQLELFGAATGSHALLHCWQRMADRFDAWAPWDNLGGNIRPGPAVGRNSDGRLEVFALDRSSANMQRIYQVVTTNGTRWSPWTSFGGPLKPGIAVGQNADGRLEVFAVNDKHPDVMHRWQLRANGSDQWSGWWSLWGSVQPYPVVGRNQDGNLELFGIDATNRTKIHHRRQISANLDWLDWFSMDQPVYPYTSRTWQTEDGLPHNVVQAIAQTPDGYLWVGTPSGLARFDGERFTVFDSRNTPALKDPFVTALCVDRSGTLWVGTHTGVVQLNQGVFRREAGTAALEKDSVTVLYESRDGSMWAGTLNGLTRYRDGKVSRYRQQDGLLSDTIRAVFEDAQTNLWIGTAAGMNRLSGTRLDSFSRTNGLPDNSIRGITQDKGWRIWIGSDNGMIWYNTGQFYAYDQKYGLSDSFVSAVCEDHEGNLWVGTHSGLNRFREGRFFNELKTEGVPYDRVNTIFEDREGNLWVGSIEGLIRLTPRRFFSYNKQQGLTHNNTVSVLEARNGSLWTGTYGGGLDCLRDEQVFAYGKAAGLDEELVLALCEARDGSLWVGTEAGGGLYQLKNGRFKRYSVQDGLPDAAIKVIQEDRAGNLWLGMGQGLSCFAHGSFTNYTASEGFPGHTVRVICEDDQGTLWFGTEAGLVRLENGRFATFTTQHGLSDNSITALHEDDAHNLWIGTASGGLNRLRLDSGATPNPEGPQPEASPGAGSSSGVSSLQRIRPYTSREGLFSDEILEVLEDDYGWLWLSCPKGVFRVARKDLDALDSGRAQALTSIAYGKSDGMAGTLCNGIAKPAGWKARDGRLWFATTKGLVVVDPNIRVNEQAPPVFIEQVLADQKIVSRSVGAPAAGSNLQAGPAAQPLLIQPGRGELEFHFTALNYQAPEKTRFRYKLEGADTDWTEPEVRRLAHYVNLYPGHYRFQVIACNSDGVWNERGAALELVLQPHLWQTWWFRGLAALAGLGAAGGAARYLTLKRVQRKLRLLEQQTAIEKERGRIAKDIHDELGSSLTRIMMLGARARAEVENPAALTTHVDKIVSSAQATVQSMDEIVWAVNPENDTLDGLVGYLNQYVNQFFENTTVRCRLELPVASTALTLPAELRHDLFLVVKEALNNVLRHAQATEVQVKVTEQGGVVEIVIADNGCGFDPTAVRPGRKGHGLGNMSKRMEGLGGQLFIEAVPGQGTRLCFLVRVNQQAL